MIPLESIFNANEFEYLTLAKITSARAETRRMMKEIQEYFESMVELPLIRHSNRQRIEILINEEALLLVKYLRDEKKTWIPRIDLLRSHKF